MLNVHIEDGERLEQRGLYAGVVKYRTSGRT